MDKIGGLPGPGPGFILPSSLSSLYSSLSSVNKSVFIRVFSYLWRYFMFKRSVYSCMHNYWAVEMVISKYSLASSDYALLSLLYQQTNGGRNVVHSRYLYEFKLCGLTGAVVRYKLTQFKDRGLITRYSRDPSAPYLQRSCSIQKVYIMLSGKGVELFDKIERDVYNMVRGSALKDITTGNKKVRAKVRTS
jgi:hypothetical protein